MHDENTTTTIEAVRVTGDEVPFLPTVVGNRHALHFEFRTYQRMGWLVDAYHGGQWNFYRLGNGGFYMAPDNSERMRLSVESNGFIGEMTSDAAGIVASLFALNDLANETELDLHIERYHQLRDFALDHAEAALILGAID